MRRLRSLLTLLILIAVLAFGLLFSIANDTPVSLDLLLVQLPEQRLSLWLILTFFVGGLLGMASASVALFRLRASRFKLQQRLKKLESRAEPRSEAS
ncbi:LapA family protein [Spongiibacter sp. KMU-158]|uniref:LapA family protein n=1 Tax=Spongiibacter pelagi TaxID=2760804 RepID=A0A927C5S4_9GAMM|nr:LapA family protein [Spongiibacter pelagi]MBD2859915.1 LapA family protein [Spongiibacter pelagi]